MNKNWIKLIWTRPRTEKYPKIWRIFEARDLDSEKLTEYRIEDLPESRFEDAIDHLEKFYLKYEPAAGVLGGCNDAQYVADYRMVCRSELQQKTSFACFRACSDQIVGVQTQYVLTRSDCFSKLAYERCLSPKVKKMYNVDAVLTKQFNVFDSYGVSEYLYLHNLAVDARFRGLNIGWQMLDASKDFCRDFNIKLLHGIFTSDFSNPIGDELDFKVDLAMSFDEMNKAHPELSIQDIKSKGMALRSLVL